VGWQWGSLIVEERQINTGSTPSRADFKKSFNIVDILMPFDKTRQTPSSSNHYMFDTVFGPFIHSFLHCHQDSMTRKKVFKWKNGTEKKLIR
jgi:hypothetical protein